MAEKNGRVTLDIIERDFSAAVDRLLANNPSNPLLKKQAAKNRLRISPSTVALEAGRSRTLIAMENCRLPQIRDRILSAQRKSGPHVHRGKGSAIQLLREEVARLKRELVSALEAQGEHFRAREKAEREAAKWRDALRRVNDHAKEDAKVVPMRPRV